MYFLHGSSVRQHLGESYTDADLVFCNEDRAPWAADTFSEQFSAIATAAGLHDCRFQDIRHAFATLRLALVVLVDFVR